ncbi:MAG: hypothetical protein ACW964_15125 [Candidatus Hodarchaeales archaeon]|jgi:hypothetical protein
MPKQRRYKTQWHRYGTIIGVLLVALGGLFMIIVGIEAFLRQAVPDTFFLSNYITLDENLSFLLSLVTIVCGIAILVITVHQKPHSQETVVWVILAAVLAIIGGTLGGLITFGGALIYAIFYFI